MNFLAHIYLSGNNDLIKVGNFVADWIKGNDYLKYPPDIQKGILIHRSIDSYTDHHKTVRQSKSRLTEKYRKYAGIIIDIFYDHYLANEWHIFCDIPLDAYAEELNKTFKRHIHYFPEEIQDFFPRFMKNRWIESYGTLEGIEAVLNGMSKHTSLPDHTETAMEILRKHYSDFRFEFYDYFPQLIAYIKEKYQIVI